MTNHRRHIVVVAALLLAVCVPALALWCRFPDDEPVQADLPPATLKAVNSHKRVWGEGGDTGLRFCFKGDTQDLNAFLEAVAKDQDVASLYVTLIPAPGTDRPEPFKDDFVINYAWEMRAYGPRHDVFVEPEGAGKEKQHPAELVHVSKLVVNVNIHCVGAMDIDKLRIPLAFKTSVGGHLGEIVDFHNRRREKAIAKHQPLSKQPPTDRAAIESTYGAFGGASTRPADQSK